MFRIDRAITVAGSIFSQDDLEVVRTAIGRVFCVWRVWLSVSTLDLEVKISPVATTDAGELL